MRKLFWLAAVGIAFFVSCDKEPKEDPKPFPIGSWQTTHQHFVRIVNNAYPELETIKEMRETETSNAIAEADSYRLTFNEDGTGSGSGVLPDGTGRYDFDFTWELSDGELTITGTQSGNEDVHVFYFGYTSPDIINTNFNNVNIWEDMVWKESVTPMEKVYWEIEESSVDNMVLSTFIQIETIITGFAIELDETHTYRYTFKKVVMMPKAALFEDHNRGEIEVISPLLFWVFYRRLI